MIKDKFILKEIVGKKSYQIDIQINSTILAFISAKFNYYTILADAISH